MLVEKWMSKKVITIDEKASLQDALQLLKVYHIQRLPVLRNGRLVGIVTDRDLKSSSASDATSLEIHELLYLLSKVIVKDIMTKDPITVSPDFTIEETADILMRYKISGVPVVDDKKKLVGIITQTDLFKLLVLLTGLKRKGVQFGCQVSDFPGSVREITDIIRDHGGRIASVLTFYEGNDEGPLNIYIRAYHLAAEDVKAITKKMEETSQLMYVIDYDRQKREIY